MGAITTLLLFTHLITTVISAGNKQTVTCPDVTTSSTNGNNGSSLLHVHLAPYGTKCPNVEGELAKYELQPCMVRVNLKEGSGPFLKQLHSLLRLQGHITDQDAPSGHDAEDVNALQQGMRRCDGTYTVFNGFVINMLTERDDGGLHIYVVRPPPDAVHVYLAPFSTKCPDIPGELAKYKELPDSFRVDLKNTREHQMLARLHAFLREKRLLIGDHADEAEGPEEHGSKDFPHFQQATERCDGTFIVFNGFVIYKATVVGEHMYHVYMVEPPPDVLHVHLADYGTKYPQEIGKYMEANKTLHVDAEWKDDFLIRLYEFLRSRREIDADSLPPTTARAEHDNVRKQANETFGRFYGLTVMEFLHDDEDLHQVHIYLNRPRPIGK